MNPTGIKPVEYKILIQVDEIGDQSAGGLWLAQSMVERDQMAHDRGTLVDASEMAFSDWKGRRPNIGEKIIFNKYAGSVINFRSDDPDDRTVQRFRLCNDKDGCAILEE